MLVQLCTRYKKLNAMLECKYRVTEKQQYEEANDAAA